MLQFSFSACLYDCFPAWDWEIQVRQKGIGVKWLFCAWRAAQTAALRVYWLSNLSIRNCNKWTDRTFYSMSAADNWQDYDDGGLIRVAQSGDVEAFGEIYTRYAQAIYRFLNAHLDDPQDVEDILVEVFLRVWRVLPEYQERGAPFQVFLFRVAHNRLIDHYRRAGHKPPQISIDQSNLVERQIETKDGILTQLENADLRQMMKQLRDDYRAVLVLRFINGLSPVEVAQIMGRSVGAIRVLQHRALAAVRVLLNKRETQDG